MAVNGVELALQTGFAPGAGSDGDLYLGIGGREFFVDFPNSNDFVTGVGPSVYMFGRRNVPGSLVPRTTEHTFNDPNQPVQMREEDVEAYPVYLRFQGRDRGDNIQIASARVTVFVGRSGGPLFELWFQNIWLGTRRGEFVRLNRISNS